MEPPVTESVIEELRLTAFKSFRGATLPLGDLTLLVGRNGSGKSNALDGLWVLSRLAHGGDVREALDGGRDGPAVRGGVEGCAPLGTTAFTLGCTVRTGTARVHLDVTVQTAPSVQVVAERLVHDDTLLLETDHPDRHSNDLRAAWASGQRGTNPTATFRASHLLTPQVFTRIPTTKAGRRIHLAAGQVVAALRHVFVLDPVPNQMRQYVREGDTELRRNAENLSAAINDLLRDEGHRHRIVAALGRLNEQTVLDVTTTISPLRDVMLLIRERTGDRIDDVPIRLASDGTLRFLAVLTALMQAPTIDQHPDDVAVDDVAGQTTLVIEELENGLHASQARTAIDLIRDEVRGRRIRILATAHSPAVLGALTPDEHGDVVVCTRGRGGASRLQRLVELEDYTRIVAAGGPGRAVEHDTLRDVPHDHSFDSILDVLDRLV